MCIGRDGENGLIRWRRTEVVDMPAAKKAPKKRKAKQTTKPDGRSKRGKYEEWLTEDGLLKLAAWSRDGLTKEQIAHNCGCSLSTLKDWCKKYPAISTALSRAREVTDIIVENSAYKSANGYTVRLAKTFKLKRVEFDPNTGRKVAEQEYLQEGFEEVHIPANVQAQQWWLRNRKPDVWRDKPSEHDHDGGEKFEMVFDIDEEEEDANNADCASKSE